MITKGGKVEREMRGRSGGRVEERAGIRIKVDEVSAGLCDNTLCLCERISRADFFRYLESSVQKHTCCLAYGVFVRISVRVHNL